jgi:hypothetical protein
MAVPDRGVSITFTRPDYLGPRGSREWLGTERVSLRQHYTLGVNVCFSPKANLRVLRFLLLDPAGERKPSRHGQDHENFHGLPVPSEKAIQGVTWRECLNIQGANQK